jgi:hypothetical protein
VAPLRISSPPNNDKNPRLTLTNAAGMQSRI